MAKLVICSVRDRAVETFGRPFFVAHVNGALRSFSDEVNDAEKRSALSQHPDDYELYEVGIFDDNVCNFELKDKPRLVAVGKDLVKIKKE